MRGFCHCWGRATISVIANWGTGAGIDHAPADRPSSDAASTDEWPVLPPADLPSPRPRAYLWGIGLTVLTLLFLLYLLTISSNTNRSPYSAGTSSSPSPSSSIPGRPEDYNELLSHLPASERSTCRSGSSLLSSQLAEAHCYTGWYSLWKTDADARDWVLDSDLKLGDCMHSPPEQKGAYQDWTTNERSGLLTCFRDSEQYLVEWSIESLRITGYLAEPNEEDYQELVTSGVVTK